MTSILHLASRVGDLLSAPFGDHAGWALLAWSVVFGLMAILLFKLATPQKRLAAARDRLIGHLLEAALFQTSLRTILAVQGRLLVANLCYLMTALPAIVALVVPLLLVLPQLEARFGRRPLDVGEAALVTAAVAGDAQLSLAGDAGIVVEAGPVRDDARGEVVWRVRAQAAGRHELRLSGAGEVQSLEVAVAEPGLAALTAARHVNGFDQLVFDPAGVPLPRDGAVRRLAVALPSREVGVAGVVLPWLVSFTLLSLAAGLLLKKPLSVEL